jgi:succinate dehydrogenase / fumarate reductase, cytochrome b subunit
MRSRPLSPHLGVYKFMYTMALSILHRITGVALSAGLLLLAFWLMALAAGEASYERAYDFLSHGLAQVVIAGWLLAFVYHLCNGVRHLTWDAGFGLEKHEARRSATVTVVATVLIFAALIYIAFVLRAGGAA